MIEIEAVCDASSIGCFRQVFLLIYATLMLVISIRCIFQMKKILNRYSYEHLPLASCMLQSGLHCFMFFFYSDNQFEILAAYLCLFTFVFVTQSFVYLYYKLKCTIKTFKDLYRYIIYGVSGYLISLSIITLVCLVKINPLNCDQYFNIGLSVQLMSMCFSAIICWWYGTHLKQMVSESLNQKETSSSPLFESTPIRQQEQLKSQITFVTYTLIVSSLLFVILFCVEVFGTNDALCIPSKLVITTRQNIFLMFYALTEMTPCLLIPYVFYYLPQISKQDNTNYDETMISFDDHPQDSFKIEEQEFANIVHKRLQEMTDHIEMQ